MLFAWVIAAVVAAPASAGVVLRYNVSIPAIGKIQEFQQSVQGGEARVEYRAPDGRFHPAFLAKVKPQWMAVLDYRKKHYMVIDDNALAGMRLQHKQMEKETRERMEKLMKNLPPEQRKQMQATLGGGPKSPLALKALGTKQVGSWTCSRYRATRGATAVEEICAIPHAKAGLQSAEVEAMRELQQRMRAGLGGDSAEDEAAVWKLGFPVERVSFDTQGKPQTIFTVVEIRSAQLAAGLATLPPGYTQQPSVIPPMAQDLTAPTGSPDAPGAPAPAPSAPKPLAPK